MAAGPLHNSWRLPYPPPQVFSRAELETIASLVQEHDAYAALDEVYEHLVYPGAILKLLGA